MARIRMKTRLAVVSLTFAVAVLPAMASAAPPLPTPEWLVDLARDYGLNRRGKQSPPDVLHVRTLLRAASRLNPELAEAHQLLYELAELRGDTSEANEQLSALVTLDPEQQTAFARWIESGGGQTRMAEQRRTWLGLQLNRATTDVNRAVVHVELAKLALEGMDPAAAADHLAQARRLYPYLPQISVVQLGLLGPDAAPHERLAAMLGALRGNPVQVELPWQIGTLLDGRGFSGAAHEFYTHAAAVHNATAPGGPIPSAYIRQLSRNAFARGDRGAGAQYAKEAARGDRESYASSFYLYWALSATEQAAQAALLRDQLAERFAAVTDRPDQPVALLTYAAWFYCVIIPQPERARLLAEAALARDAANPFVQLVHGCSLAIGGESEAAITALTPLAGHDADAASMLAKLLIDAGRESEAAALIDRLPALPVAGPTRERIDKLGLPTATTRPAAERSPAIASVLAEFDRSLLGFHEAPWRFLKAELRFEDLSPSAGEPWWAEFSLTNETKYPISLGPQQMVNPVFLLSFTMEGDKARQYDALFTVSLDRVGVLAPGERVAVRRTVDIGPLRRVVRRTPQQLQRVSVVAILDPQQDGAGVWKPSVSGQQLRLASMNRMPTRTTREVWHALFSALAGDSRAARFRALDETASLLAESQYVRMGRLSYSPEPIPTDRIHQLLIDALGSESWENRVRTLEAVQIVGLDQELLDAVYACLDHEHWLVRLMAVRLLGERLGEKFAERARLILSNDSDELVRDLARSVTERYTVASGAPADPTAD
jgi:hypothetical protein